MIFRNNKLAHKAINYIQHYTGLQYKWGGDDPLEGFDCSGLAIEMLMSVGLVAKTFDSTAQGLLELYFDKGVKKALPGCLVFFGKDIDHISHVGIAIDDNLMIEAGGGGPGTKTKNDAVIFNAFIKMRPINSRADLIGMVDPFI